jgi:hypothetical protein
VASVDSCLRLFSSRSSHGHLVGETDRRSTTGADIPDDWRGSGKADYSQLGIELVAVSDDAPSSLWPRTIGDASSDTHPGHARTFARLNAAGRDAVRCALKAVAGTRPQAARPRDDAHADRRIRTRQRLSEAGPRPMPIEQSGRPQCHWSFTVTNVITATKESGTECRTAGQKRLSRTHRHRGPGGGASMRGAAGSSQHRAGRSSPPAENALSKFMASSIPDRRSV